MGAAKTASKSAAKAKAASHSASKSSHHKHSRRNKKGAWKRHGQQSIDSERVRQIQLALIREKYLSGEPSGQWDSTTQSAMSRYQNDNGWQSKVTPDSRALIKLGLGPNHEEGSLNLEGRDTVAANPVASPAAGTSNRQ